MRDARAAVAATAVLAAAGCGLLGGTEGRETPSSPPVASSSSDASAGYSASCTGDGTTQIRSSVQSRDETVPGADGAALLTTLAWTSSGADGDGTVALYLQSSRAGAEQERVEDLHVGDVASYEDWTVTVRSVCQDSAGIDIAAG